MTIKRDKANRTILFLLLSIFCVYNVNIYLGSTSRSSISFMSESALKGEKLWQENNCTACHQLYGLGGYLGPDLTNIISNPLKGRVYAKVFFNSGIKSMPKFNFTEDEKNHLLDFLTHVDSSGYYPNKKVDFKYLGWVEISYK